MKYADNLKSPLWWCCYVVVPLIVWWIYWGAPASLMAPLISIACTDVLYLYKRGKPLTGLAPYLIKGKDNEHRKLALLYSSCLLAVLVIAGLMNY